MAKCWSVGLADPNIFTGSPDLSMEGPWKDSRVSRATVGQATVILRFFLGDLLAEPFGKYEHTNTHGPHVEISNSVWTAVPSFPQKKNGVNGWTFWESNMVCCKIHLCSWEIHWTKWRIFQPLFDSRRVMGDNQPTMTCDFLEPMMIIWYSLKIEYTPNSNGIISIKYMFTYFPY